MVASVKCPTCRRSVEWSPDSPHRPFCSNRCQLIDLGSWLAEQHKLPDDSIADGGEAPVNDLDGL